MPKVRFAVESAQAGDNPGVTSQRLVNCYAAPTSQGARSPFVLRSVLGYAASPLADLGNKVVRASIEANGTLYVVASGFLHSVSGAGVVTSLGALQDDEDTTISANGDNITVTAGGNYYVWNGATVSQPSGGAFAGEGSVAFIDQYTVISERNGRAVEWTELADPSTRDAINVKIKEGRTDRVVRVLAAQGRLWVMGEKSSELWYNTGQAGALAFERVQGAVVDTGLRSRRLCMAYENVVFMVGDDDVFYRGSGLQFTPLSTSAVNKALEDGSPTHVFAYEDRGHKFVCVRFSDRPAWCYDLATGGWHERASGVNNSAWDIVETANVYGKWYGITALGVIHEMSRTNADGAEVLRREMTSLPLDVDGEYVSIRALEFRVQNGFADLGRDAEATLTVSRNGGATFGLEKTATFGTIGEYAQRVRFRALGRSRHFTCKLAITDAAELPVESDALLEAA